MLKWLCIFALFSSLVYLFMLVMYLHHQEAGHDHKEHVNQHHYYLDMVESLFFNDAVDNSTNTQDEDVLDKLAALRGLVKSGSRPSKRKDYKKFEGGSDEKISNQTNGIIPKIAYEEKHTKIDIRQIENSQIENNQIENSQIENNQNEDDNFKDVTPDSASNPPSPPSSDIHIVYASDFGHIVGIQASIASLIFNCLEPKSKLNIHIIISNDNVFKFQQALFGLDESSFYVDKNIQTTDEFEQSLLTFRVIKRLTSGPLLILHVLDNISRETALPQSDKRDPETYGSKSYGHSIIKAAKVQSWVYDVRGNIRSLENYARFYLDSILKDYNTRFVVYLDSDTIVQTDFSELLDYASEGVVADNKRELPVVLFAKRNRKTKLKQFLDPLHECTGKDLKSKLKYLQDYEAFNAGFFVLDLVRYRELKIRADVEAWIDLHNTCRLWEGGSQPPFLLALYDNHPETTIKTISSSYNFADLGWRRDFNLGDLLKQRVLHWNGPRKPWNRKSDAKNSPLYQSCWRVYADRVPELLLGNTKQGYHHQSGDWKVYQNRTLIMNDLTANCSIIMTKRKSNSPCEYGHSFGCLSYNKIWVDSGCRGKFVVMPLAEKVESTTSHSVDKFVKLATNKHTRDFDPDAIVYCKSRESKFTTCSSEYFDELTAGTCSTQILTTYFSVRHRDWQREDRVHDPLGKFKYISRLYNSVQLVDGVNVEILHDGLPDNFTRNYTTDQIKFVYCDTEEYDGYKLGVNDVRYFCFKKRLEENPEWQTIFTTDVSDVYVLNNPCKFVRKHKDRLFVAREMSELPSHPWMSKRFMEMGGKYSRWFMDFSTSGGSGHADRRIFNCGLVGGTHQQVSRLVREMLEIITDSQLEVRKQRKEVNVNMAALNYLAFNWHDPVERELFYDAPFHSKYKHFEKDRSDVWFIHK